MSDSVVNKVISRIYGRKRGCVVSANDFIKDFKRNDVDKALSTLTKKGMIKRLIPGIYYYPEHSTLLNKEISPSINKVADAIARKFNWDIQPTGDTALQFFSISTQIPAKYVNLSDGPDRKYDINGVSLYFKKAKLQETKLKYTESKLLVQAIKTQGKEYISDKEIKKMKKSISKDKYSYIKHDTVNIAEWIREIILKVIEE